VGEQHAEAAPAQLLGAVDERVVDALERHLVEHPPRARAAVGDHLELGVGEHGDRLGLELAADLDAQVDALGGQRARTS
jgi:hypothetical protein